MKKEGFVKGPARSMSCLFSNVKFASFGSSAEGRELARARALLWPIGVQEWNPESAWREI